MTAKKVLCILYMCIAATYAIATQAEGPIVHTKHGPLEGTINLSISSRKYASFLGIPYAKPPLGELRFAPTEPFDSPWDDVRDATKEGNVCVQFDLVGIMQSAGDEDCLFLNVFTPLLDRATTDKRLPVMVWIHGGGFSSGASDPNTFYNPAYLMDRDVVVVSINYRLHVLGFLSTEDDEAPGNYGLHDQVEALRWVQTNIDTFGGDPDRVTIFGESAGGASTHLLMVSPLSKGLFHAAISISGNAFEEWTIRQRPRVSAEKLAEHFNCSTRTSAQMINCLRTIPALDFSPAAAQAILEWTMFPAAFFPTIDVGTRRPFMPDFPARLYGQKRFHAVPWMTGINVDEGAMYSAGLYANETIRKELDADWDHICPFVVGLDVIEPQEKALEACKKIRKFYFEDKPLDLDAMPTFGKMMGSIVFSTGLPKAIKLHAESAPVFAYSFRYHGVRNLFRMITSIASTKEAHQLDFIRTINDTSAYGVSHGDDLPYYWYMRGSGCPITPLEKEAHYIKEFMLDFFTNFAIHGTPTPGSYDRIPFAWPSLHAASGTAAALDSTEKFWSRDAFMAIDVEPKLVPGKEVIDVKAAEFLECLGVYENLKLLDSGDTIPQEGFGSEGKSEL